MDGSDGCTTLQINLMPLTCTLKMVSCIFLPQFKIFKEIFLKLLSDLTGFLNREFLPYLRASWLVYGLEFSCPVPSPKLPILSFSWSPTISEAGNTTWLHPFPPCSHLDIHQILTPSSCQLHLFLPTANTLA